MDVNSLCSYLKLMSHNGAFLLALHKMKVSFSWLWAEDTNGLDAMTVINPLRKSNNYFRSTFHTFQSNREDSCGGYCPQAYSSSIYFALSDSTEKSFTLIKGGISTNFCSKVQKILYRWNFTLLMNPKLLFYSIKYVLVYSANIAMLGSHFKI